MRPPALRVDELRHALRGCLLGREIQMLETITSTNDAIRQRLTSNAPTGLTIFSETQTAGRGQRGHGWESISGKGLWFSTLLRPQIALHDAPVLTLWAAMAVRDVISALSIDATVKAPNDVLVRSRKVAGVLVEMVAQAQAAHLAILGVGLNVNHSLSDFSEAIRHDATSVALSLGREIDRTGLAIALLRRLNATYRW